jgi:hypothetical protein
MLEEGGGGRPLSLYKTHALYALYCRLVKTAPCIAVYTSSLTIVAIALDRHRVIVHSGRQQVFTEKLERDGPCRLLKLRQKGTQRVHMIGLLGSSCRYKRVLSCLGCFTGVGPVQNIFFLIVHSLQLPPLPNKLGGQSCRVACLLICVSGHFSDISAHFFACTAPKNVNNVVKFFFAKRKTKFVQMKQDIFVSTLARLIITL